MKTEVKIPEVGESVKEALLSQWYRRDGDFVRKGDILFIMETDKVTLEVVAEADGVLRIMVAEGATVPVGKVVATIEAERALERGVTPPLPALKEEAAPGVGPGREFPLPQAVGAEAAGGIAGFAVGRGRRDPAPHGPNVAPAALQLAEEKRVDLGKVPGTGPGGRITRGDVFLYLEQASIPAPETPLETPQVLSPGPTPEGPGGADAPETTLTVLEPVTRKPLSPIRQRIAERLLSARQNTAMLTTFNEVDMSRVQAMRAHFKEAYKAKYDVSLGIMSFFVKASVMALQEFPSVNAFIDGQHIVYHHYYHIGVAVGAERGLVVPVIRHADRLGFAAIESAIQHYFKKIQENRLELADLEGGTFTISNGGVYGSLLSTPILNTPQSGVLGLHKIEDRPVAIGGEVVIRPMMYVALTYDHRIIDGREGVSFLKRIKECVENPERIMLEV
jgi:2-oxoglutarate dehydrogenase E2 component (dihydrolipoamide succinyltransferase)